jgi:hypothetical protein
VEELGAAIVYAIVVVVPHRPESRCVSSQHRVHRPSVSLDGDYQKDVT